MAEGVATREQSLEALKAELAGIDGAIEDAAVQEDSESFLSLTMRREALPRLIREARANPVRERVERLEAELEALEDERQRVLDGDFEVPENRRGDLDALMLRNQRLGSITQQSSRIGHHLEQARVELRQIEGSA